MRKEIRKKEVKLRKNFFPTLIVTIFLWMGVASVIYFVEPDSFGALPLFFFLLFFSFLFTFSLIFANTRRGVLSAIGFTIFLLLRYFGVGNILNFLLIFGILLSFEIYFSRK